MAFSDAAIAYVNENVGMLTKALTPEGASYVDENVGYSTPLAPEGVSYVDENVGVNTPVAPQGGGYLDENVGLPLPTVVAVTQPQQGWGSPVVPAREVSLIVEMAKAVEYVTEGDVTT